MEKSMRVVIVKLRVMNKVIDSEKQTSWLLLWFLWVKALPRVPMWRLEWDSNLRPSGHKEPDLPLCHHVPYYSHKRYIPSYLVLLFCSSCFELPSFKVELSLGSSLKMRNSWVRFNCMASGTDISWTIQDWTNCPMRPWWTNVVNTCLCHCLLVALVQWSHSHSTWKVS